MLSGHYMSSRDSSEIQKLRSFKDYIQVLLKLLICSFIHSRHIE